MSMPFYVSPEQLMKDRADFARKGIARGRSVAVVQYADGIVFVSENPSQALHKVSEIYDRIAFAAVGRYNEFENLRIAGVRLADMRGYAYDRRDVTGRGLANAYAQALGTIFSSGGEKPYEVEIFVAEVGDAAEDDQIYRLTYDGQVADEHGYAVMGGNAELAAAHLKEHYTPGWGSTTRSAWRWWPSVARTAAAGAIAGGDLEVASLDRTRSQQRKFRRLTEAQLGRILGDRGGGRRPALAGPRPVVGRSRRPRRPVRRGRPVHDGRPRGDEPGPPVAPPPVAPPTCLSEDQPVAVRRPRSPSPCYGSVAD